MALVVAALLIGLALLDAAIYPSSPDTEVLERSVVQGPSGPTYILTYQIGGGIERRITRSGTALDEFVRDCFEPSSVGQQLPAACARPSGAPPNGEVSTREALGTFALVAGTILALFAYASLRIARVRPSRRLETAPTSTNTVRELATASDRALSLMTTTQREREAYHDEWQTRQSLSRPGRGRRYFALGFVIASLLTVPVLLVFGLDRARDWALITGALIALGLAILYVASLTSMLSGGSAEEPLYQRMAFMGGAAAPLLIWGGTRLMELSTLE